MPRSRSRSIESSTCSWPAWLRRIRPVTSSRRSASVDLPWSTWAMMQKLRMSDWFTRSVRSRFGAGFERRVAQECGEARERAAAMAHAILRGRLGLREGLPELRGEEEGIVAEPAGAALRREDRPLAGAVGLEEDVPLLVGEAGRAAEAGGASGGLDARELLQELPAVGFVAGIGRLAGVPAAGGGVARGADSRRAAERVDLEPRVVGHAGEPGPPGVPDRLLARVGGEGRPLLWRVLELRVVLQVDEVDPGVAERAGEDALYLGALLLVAGREQEDQPASRRRHLSRPARGAPRRARAPASRRRGRGPPSRPRASRRAAPG